MKKIISISIFIILCFFSSNIKADNAPVTSAGSVVNAPLSPSITSVPLTVSNFVDIGSFTLTLDYTNTILTYVSVTPDPVFTGLTVNSSTPGRIVITWPASGFGVTLPDQASILSLNFHYIDSGTLDTIKWFDNGISCQYTKYSGGSYIILNDSPTSTYYVHGLVTNHTAPIVIAPVITAATPGAVSVPIKVAGFTDIGSIYLNLEYDPNVLIFQGFTVNPLVPDTFIIGNNNSTGGKMKLTMSWFGAGFSLADSSILVTLNFNYSNTSGQSNYAELNWLEDGPSCEFSDGEYRVLVDYPTANYYKNGLTASQLAPQSLLPVITDAIGSNPVLIPVKTSAFTNIRSFTLTFEYDPATLTYGTFTPNIAFGGLLNVSDAVSGSKRKVVISWSGASVLTLPDGSSIATLNFTYNTGTTELNWLTADANACRYNDNVGNAYYSIPKSGYFHNGFVTNHGAPITAILYASPANGQQFTVPVQVFHFNNIGSFSLTLDYDPGVLTYQSATLVPLFGGTWSASSLEPGRIIMNWTGSAASIADSSDLIHITFTKSAGNTFLTWYDNGNSCMYAETNPGPSLYDQPQSAHYVNGYVGSTPLVADFTADNTTPPINSVVTFSDISAGGPASWWYWEISPSTYIFTNGTNASSNSPKIEFTAKGAYTVILIVNHGSSGGIKYKKDYIHAGTAGLWTGTNSGSWTTASNWDNLMVPVNVTDVLIPASAPNWPEFTGNLVLGAQCRNLTLNGASQITIDGNLTINSGKSLIFTGAGTLFLGGNWSDSGVFSAGTGTVNFTGPADVTLTSSSPETFYKIEVSKPGAKLSIPGTVTVAGM